MLKPQARLSSYKLSDVSLRQLIGVHPRLVGVVRSAILISDQDFRVTDGIRVISEQSELVAAGKSWTLQSKHLLQRDGFGHAVDLVPWVGGGLSWSWPLCCWVAAAMKTVAHQTGVELRWGGVWDRPMSAIAGHSDTDLGAAVAGYVARRRRAGRRAAIDGPHFEIV